MDELVNVETIEEPEFSEIEILEEVKEKYNNNNTENTKISDVVVTQCILCLIILAGVLVLNIFQPNLSQGLVEKYKTHISSATEEVIVNAVTKLNDILKSVPK